MWDLVNGIAGIFSLIVDVLFPGPSSDEGRALPMWVGWMMFGLLTVAIGILIWSFVRN